MKGLSLKERAAMYKAKKESKLTYFLSNLNNISGAMLTNESDMFYMISPSNYKQSYFQLTTFIRNEPFSHTQEPSINELIKTNINELLSYSIQEVC